MLNKVALLLVLCVASRAVVAADAEAPTNLIVQQLTTAERAYNACRKALTCDDLRALQLAAHQALYEANSDHTKINAAATAIKAFSDALPH